MTLNIILRNIKTIMIIGVEVKKKFLAFPITPSDPSPSVVSKYSS